MSGRARSACQSLGLATLAGLMALGCSRSGSETAHDAGASATTTQAATTAPDAGAGEAPKPGAGAGARATAAAKPGAKSAWSVTFALAPAKLYIPDSKDWSGTKQAKSDDAKLVGEGKMSLEVNATGRVSGATEDGPLGAAVIDGRLDDGTLRATLRRKDPSDEGLTGTLFASVTGDKLEGTMELADGTAASVREAKVSGSKAR